MKNLMSLAILLLPITAFTADLRFVGTAKPVDGGQTLYQETHEVSGSCQQGIFKPETHSVSYTRPDGGQFATKNLSYTQSILRPSMKFAQPDFSETIRMNNHDDQELEVVWQQPNGKTERALLDIIPALVADAGFDNFVRQQWNPVALDGQSVKFDMVAPTRGDFYGFVLEPATDARLTAEHLLRIRPSAFVLRFLVDPILLGYNSDGLLTDYLGLTNIRKNEDDNYIAHIRYDIETKPECELTR